MVDHRPLLELIHEAKAEVTVEEKDMDETDLVVSLVLFPPLCKERHKTVLMKTRIQLISQEGNPARIAHVVKKRSQITH